jgi:LL-diaminopimelate aminotransferase
MAFEKAERLGALPPYLFAEIDRRKRDALAAGRDVINLGIGDPDRPTPRFIIDALGKAAADPANHRYPFDEGVPRFRHACAEFLQKRYGVSADPTRQILTLIGSKEGLAHFGLAAIDPDDVSLVPSPGYPVYRSASIFAGASVYYLDLREPNGFLPDLDAVPADIAAKASVLWLNYPNNPTSAIASPQFLAKAVAFAKAHDLAIVQDAAYGEVYFDDADRPHSILEVDGAMDVAVELHSLSKTFNMTGWRLAFAVGAEPLIAALAQMKGNCDSGQFNAIQWAGVAALEHYDCDEVVAMRQVYRARRDALVGGLRAAGWVVNEPKATFYTWIHCPPGLDSMTVAGRLLDEADVVLIPGAGFGEAAEGYLRAALTVEIDRIREAVERIGKLRW